MKGIAVALLIFSPVVWGGEKAWLEPVPIPFETNRKAIPDESFFEVPASRLGAAESWLKDSMFLAQADAGYFGRPDFRCAAPAKVYLVRAAYMNGGTGRFFLSWAGSALIISHASLGHAGSPIKSALVACLSQEPTAIYSWLSGAL